jgi:hypothetical protein
VKTLLRAACAALLVLAATASAPPKACVVRASGGRVARVPPTSVNTAAFLVLHNPGPKALALVKASSPAAEATELHEMTMQDGRARMRPVARLEIPAGDSLALAPGGTHVMLIGLKAPLAEGALVPLRLTFSDRTSLDLRLPVQRAQH